MIVEKTRFFQDSTLFFFLGTGLKEARVDVITIDLPPFGRMPLKNWRLLYDPPTPEQMEFAEPMVLVISGEVKMLEGKYFLVVSGIRNA